MQHAECCPSAVFWKEWAPEFIVCGICRHVNTAYRFECFRIFLSILLRSWWACLCARLRAVQVKLQGRWCLDTAVCKQQKKSINKRVRIRKDGERNMRGGIMSPTDDGRHTNKTTERGQTQKARMKYNEWIQNNSEGTAEVKGRCKQRWSEISEVWNLVYASVWAVIIRVDKQRWWYSGSAWINTF